MSKKRVFVAMSGGVDSSMAAALLKEDGYEVSGIHMELSPNHCPEHSILDLEHTCQFLDIPLYKLNMEPEYRKDVIDYFCDEYSKGRTPNPCVACNRHIKFGLLLDKVLEMGADYLATGHYARIRYSPEGYRLLRALDPTKDQSYFLYTLGQHELQHMLLPIGNHLKTKIRKMAKEKGLPVSDAPESQDVCFIRDKDYRTFIATRLPLKAGDIVDTTGKVLGKHNGLALYTIGQRQGLGIASNERLYALKLDAASNRLVVGTEDRLFQNSLSASNLSWVSGKAPSEDTTITAKIRYRSPDAAVKLEIKDNTAGVWFQQPQRAISPGQSIVFYDSEVVLGGGCIE